MKVTSKRKTFPSWRWKSKQSQLLLNECSDETEEHDENDTASLSTQLGDFSFRHKPANRSMRLQARPVIPYKLSHLEYNKMRGAARRLIAKRKLRSRYSSSVDTETLLSEFRLEASSCPSSVPTDCASQHALIPKSAANDCKCRWIRKLRTKKVSVDSQRLLLSNEHEQVKGFDLEEIITEGKYKTDFQKDQQNDEIPIWILQHGKDLMNGYDVCCGQASHANSSLLQEEEEEEESAMEISESVQSPNPYLPQRVHLAETGDAEDQNARSFVQPQHSKEYRRKSRRSHAMYRVPYPLGNLSTVDELSCEEERTAGSLSTSKSRQQRNTNTAAPPMRTVSYHGSILGGHTVTDDDNLSLDEEFVKMPDGSRAQIIVEMEI